MTAGHGHENEIHSDSYHILNTYCSWRGWVQCRFREVSFAKCNDSHDVNGAGSKGEKIRQKTRLLIHGLLNKLWNNAFTQIFNWTKNKGTNCEPYTDRVDLNNSLYCIWQWELSACIKNMYWLMVDWVDLTSVGGKVSIFKITTTNSECHANNYMFYWANM